KNPAVGFTFLVAGSSFTGTGENVGRAFVHLKPWDERSTTAADFIAWALATLPRKLPEAHVSAFNLPTIRGLGQFGGFDFFLEDRGGLGREALTKAQGTVLDQAAHDSTLTGVRLNTLDPAPQLRLTVDRVQAQSMGLSVTDVYTAIQLMLAPVYADDFLYEGRVLRVLLQADAAYRMSPDALGHFYV